MYTSLLLSWSSPYSWLLHSFLENWFGQITHRIFVTKQRVSMTINKSSHAILSNDFIGLLGITQFSSVVAGFRS